MTERVIIDRIDAKGNIREHVVSDDASFTLCGLSLAVPTQKPAGNSPCSRCRQLEERQRSLKHAPTARSHRGYLLALAAFPTDRPVVTVEIYSKWYELFLVHPGGGEEAVSFGTIADWLRSKTIRLSPAIQVAYVDHVPNPVVAAWAEDMGYALDDVAEEIMIGRWTQEVGR